MNRPIIAADATGVWREDSSGDRWGIRWDEISRVAIGKLDCVDRMDTTIELDFGFGEFMELNSSFSGFEDAMEAITSQLEGFPPDWRSRSDHLKPDDASLVLWARSVR